mgnify:CR=1 FL=1
MAGHKSCRERKSVSSKVTIRNSTTLIEHSEGHSTALLQEERSDYETAFLQPLNIRDRKGVFISKKTQEEISETDDWGIRRTYSPASLRESP